MKTQKLMLPPLEEVDSSIKEVDNPRDAALLWMMRNGMRVSEACGLRLGDLYTTQGAWIARVVGKGNKMREVPLFPETVLAIWLSVEAMPWPSESDGCILYSAQRPSLTRQQAYNVCMRVTGQHPHTLRHLYATSLRNRGVSIEVLQDLLGHESITTTRIYYHTTIGDLISATMM